MLFLKISGDEHFCDLLHPCTSLVILLMVQKSGKPAVDMVDIPIIYMVLYIQTVVFWISEPSTVKIHKGRSFSRLLVHPPASAIRGFSSLLVILIISDHRQQSSWFSSAFPSDFSLSLLNLNLLNLLHHHHHHYHHHHPFTSYSSYIYIIICISIIICIYIYTYIYNDICNSHPLSLA